jgi:hypothetical protein
MSLPNRISHRIAAAVAAGCAGLVLASAAGAVDLRDWGRKFPTSERFVVLSQFNNQAVLDKETQLVWQRSPISTLQSFYAADYNSCSRTPIGARHGWRLPSRFELMTLIDPAASAPIRLPAGHPFLGITPNAEYWTSSPALGTVTNYLTINIGSFQFNERERITVAALPWCVRGFGE